MSAVNTVVCSKPSSSVDLNSTGLSGFFIHTSTANQRAEKSAQPGEIKQPAEREHLFHHHPVIAPDESKDDERQNRGIVYGFVIQKA